MQVQQYTAPEQRAFNTNEKPKDVRRANILAAKCKLIE